MKLDDESPMPFGFHRNAKLRDVPPGYLLALWDDELWRDSGLYSGAMEMEKRLAVADYIKTNFKALEAKCPDVILFHRP